jgi:uncharacterized protein
MTGVLGIASARMVRPEPGGTVLNMHIPRNAMLLRVFIGEDDKCHRQPLYEAIVLKAREQRLAGATVLRGPMGYGHSSRLHATKILRLAEDLPVVIEIVIARQRSNRFSLCWTR